MIKPTPALAALLDKARQAALHDPAGSAAVVRSWLAPKPAAQPSPKRASDPT